MNSRKSKQRNKCRKNITGLKNKDKNYKKEKRKKWKTPQNCKSPNIEGHIYNNNKNCI